MAPAPANPPSRRPRRTPQGLGAILGGGAIAGVLAGVVGLAAGAAWTENLGLGAQLIPRATAAGIWGPMALLQGAGTVTVGWLLGLAGAALLGLIYCLIGWRVRTYGTAVLWGMLFGILIWAGLDRWALPAWSPTLAAYVPLLGAVWFWLHLLFGVVLAVSVSLRRGLSGSRRQPQQWELPKAG